MYRDATVVVACGRAEEYFKMCDDALKLLNEREKYVDELKSY